MEGTRGRGEKGEGRREEGGGRALIRRDYSGDATSGVQESRSPGGATGGDHWTAITSLANQLHGSAHKCLLSLHIISSQTPHQAPTTSDGQ
ncbi:hypothetical protein RRG08_053594 [Elysia crispata]|uniref:Uncharacterized protein n=1 Tax=Elysia crispata TaxID=231223 RepID=A0AAE0Y1P9_9GAST|nr:hypothetical protein RRG08_053594 [Elysia crispata]